MDDLIRAVMEEKRRFKTALPQLLFDHPGRWVVFKDGRVQSDHGDSSDAYSAAIARFGANGGFVVTQVVEDGSPPLA